MEFKRQLYIEDLFRPEQIINAFEYVEFNSYFAYIKATNERLYQIKENTTIQIRLQNYEEFGEILELFKTTKEFFEKMKVILVIPTKELLDKIMSKEIPEDFKTIILTNHPYKTSDYWEINQKWIKKHIIGLIHTIRADTIATDMCNITEYYNIHNIRFFRLYIDYEDFSEVSVKDLDKLEYWFNYLRNWIMEKNEGINPIVIMAKNNFFRKIFVDDDLTLYLDANKDSSTWYFPLHYYLDRTGETMEAYVLNNLHKYLDLIPQAIYTKFSIKNWLLIDFNQTKKMGYYINEIPLIMGLVQRWLYGN
jgi:hypothetical protein